MLYRLTPLACAVLLAACGAPEPEGPPGGFPDSDDARAGHCHHVLYLTLERMEEFAGTGPAGGFLAERSTSDVRTALRNATDAYEGFLADPGTTEHYRNLEAVIDLVDEDGDGQLTTRRELETFNRHVHLCMDLYLRSR